MRTCFAGAIAVAVLAVSSSAMGALIVYPGTGPAGNLAARDAFRVALGGGTVAGANGSFGGVRREINWDGVPDGSSAPNALPGNFFNVNSPRGVILSTPGTSVQVSASGVVANLEFNTIDPSYSGLFAPFTAQKLFTPIGSNITDVTFFIPGTTTPGLTRAFGSVFSDVDLAIVSSIEYFDQFNASLGKFFVPNIDSANETLQFLGVDFGVPVISRVRITTGNTALGAGVLETGGTDLVVMDDFIYAEPASGGIPEPATAGLLALGAVGLMTRRKH